MYKAVIFDLDHTLYDFTGPHQAALDAINAYMCEHFGLSPGEADEKGKEAFLMTRKKVGEDSVSSHSRTLRYQTLCENLGVNEFEHAHVMGEMYWNVFYDAMKKDEAVVPVLKALHENGIRIIIGTDMTATEQFKKVERLGLAPYIDYLVTSEEEGGEKPSPRILDLCVKKAGADKSSCVFVGDHPIKDVLGPMRYGMKSVWCRQFNPEKFLDMMGFSVKVDEPIPYRFENYNEVLTPEGINLGGLQII